MEHIPIYLTFQSTSQCDENAMHLHGFPERFTIGPFDHVDLDWGAISVVPEADGGQVYIAEHTASVANGESDSDQHGWRFSKHGVTYAGLPQGIQGRTFTRCYISTGHTN